MSRYPTHSKALAHSNSAIDQTLRELAAITHGLRTKINRIAPLAPQDFQLTEKVTANLYTLSHRQLQNVHSVFSKRQYQEIVNQLFLTGSRLLDEQESAPSASMPSPRVSPDQQILSLVETVLRGKQPRINPIVNFSQTFFDQRTLTQHLKTELSAFAKQELLNTNSAFSKKTYQTIVDQLSGRTNRLLSSPEMLHVPSAPAKFPQPDYFNRQNSQQSLSDAFTASGETFENSLKHQLSYSQFFSQPWLKFLAAN